MTALVTLRCWCRHREDQHAPGECLECQRRGVSHYLNPRHRYQPIERLRRLPAFLFREQEPMR